MSARALRSLSIFGGVALAAVALMSWSQAWFLVTLSGQAASHPELAVGGDVSAPAVAALAVAAAAACAAMAISGRFFRVVLALLLGILGVAIVLSASLAMGAPEGAVQPAVTTATSIAGAASVSSLIGSIMLTVWPFVALTSGVLLALLGVAIVLTASAWPESDRRYQAVRLEPVEPGSQSRGDRSVSDWDELSGGTDPTSR